MYVCASKNDQMNKYLKIVLAILIPSFIFIYFFIPNEIKVSKEVEIAQPGVAVTRAFIMVENWGKWMPAKNKNGNTLFLDKGELQIKQSFLSSTNTQFTMGDVSLPVTFFATSKGKDTSIIKYETVIDNRHVSPIQRIVDYWTSLKVKFQMNKVLDAAGKYYANTENIYGFPIIHDRVKDSILISTNHTFTDTPSLPELYGMIHSLEKHIQLNKGEIKGAPMVNITDMGEAGIFAQVAYPLAKSIPLSDSFQIKKMVLGNILTVKVVGGPKSVCRALNETETYIQDRASASPAIPFVVYNTDRLQQKDTSKWNSTIYFPVY